LNKQQQQKRVAGIAKIKSLLSLADLKYVDIEKRYKLYTGCVYNTMNAPDEKGETAIADALGKDPSELWPERYDTKTGHRLAPQPYTNYAKLPPRSERLKAARA